MIKTEIIDINGKEFVRTYSDAGYQIRQDNTGAVYDEAIDPSGSGRTYAETDTPVEVFYTDETEAKARAYEILVGEVE